MSTDSRVAARYAKSLVSLAVEKGKLETLKADADLLKQTLDESRPLRLLLKSPIIKSDSKLKVLTKLFSSKVDEMLMLFFQIVCRKGRESFILGMIEEILKRYNEIKGIQKALVKTPIPLSADMRAKFVNVVKEVSGKSVELAEEVDQDLIGGFVIKIDDKQIDESVKRKLQLLNLQFAVR